MPLWAYQWQRRLSCAIDLSSIGPGPFIHKWARHGWLESAGGSSPYQVMLREVVSNLYPQAVPALRRLLNPPEDPHGHAQFCPPNRRDHEDHSRKIVGEHANKELEFLGAGATWNKVG